MIHKFLNIRNSLRDLSDEEFEVLLPDLAKELATVSFYTEYTDRQLFTDWVKLNSWNAHVKTMASTQRLGMKLCEHFFPNFYDVADNKGNSFTSLWTPTNLEKVLRWNRKSHSTPYLSELKRGIYFNFGLPKSTMYRPQMAKMVVENLGAKQVLDPCAGWGGRLLGCLAAEVEMYTAFEPNTETYENLQRLVKFLKVERRVRLIKDSALNIPQYAISNIDLIITSPPYFDLEVYTKEDTQSITGCDTYKEWVSRFLTPLIKLSSSTLVEGGWSCWNVHNIGKMKMIEDVANSHEPNSTVRTFSVSSSKRQMNTVASKRSKNFDATVCYNSSGIVPR